MTRSTLLICGLSPRALLCASSLVIASGLWAGCSNDVDQTENVYPWDDTGSSDGTDGTDGTSGVDGTSATDGTTGVDGTSGDATCTNCPAVGDWYRFTKLELTEVAGQTVESGGKQLIESLNGIWDVDIAKAELNILMKVTAVEDGRLDLEVVSAARVGHDGAYCRIPSSANAFGMSRTECSLASEANGSLGVYSGSIEYPKTCGPDVAPVNSIPVVEVSVASDFSGGCTVVNGVVNGMLGEEDFNSVCSCLDIAGIGNPDAYKPSDEFCKKLDPAFEGNSSGKCGGCNDRVIPLASAAQLLGGIDFTLAMTSDGKPAAAIVANFAASKVEEPVDCQ